MTQQGELFAMTKRHLLALEKCLESEIEGALRGWGRCVQSKAKVYKELEAEGLVKWTEERLGGRFPMTIEGWELTLAGHVAYCLSCDDAE